MKIAFAADGAHIHYGKDWTDGLWRALERLREKHIINVFDAQDQAGIKGFEPDVVLFWGSLLGAPAQSIKELPYSKAIAFAGGPISQQDATGFDLYFYESKVNHNEFDMLGLPNRLAFGINEETFFPQQLPKKYLACFPASFALWKRHDLFATAVGNRGVACGLFQDHEKECFEVCHRNQVEVFGSIPRHTVREIINSSHAMLNTASYWGGGQRSTLEAMACDIPVVVMADAPKNCEFVEESGFGFIVPPDVSAIRSVLEKIEGSALTGGRDYVMSKWTSQHYADALERGLESIV